MLKETVEASWRSAQESKFTYDYGHYRTDGFRVGIEFPAVAGKLVVGRFMSGEYIGCGTLEIPLDIKTYFKQQRWITQHNQQVLQIAGRDTENIKPQDLYPELGIMTGALNSFYAGATGSGIVEFLSIWLAVKPQIKEPNLTLKNSIKSAIRFAEQLKAETGIIIAPAKARKLKNEISAAKKED